MIGLGPGDSLGGAPSGACTVIATAFGEQIPVGGGAPTPYYNVVNLTASQWYTLAQAPTGFQVLVNKIVLNNQGGLAAIAVEQFTAGAPIGYVQTGALVGGSPYLTIPAGGTAIHGRDGWRILTANGSDVNAVIVEGVVQSGALTVQSGGTNMVWNGAVKTGTYLTPYASGGTAGLLVGRTGVYIITAGIRWNTPLSGNRACSITIGGSLVMNDYYQTQPPNTVINPGHNLSYVSSINNGNAINVNVWSDTANSLINTGFLNACWLGPSV